MATKPSYSLPLQGFFFFPVFVFTAVKCGQSAWRKKSPSHIKVFQGCEDKTKRVCS